MLIGQRAADDQLIVRSFVRSFVTGSKYYLILIEFYLDRYARLLKSV